LCIFFHNRQLSAADLCIFFYDRLLGAADLRIPFCDRLPCDAYLRISFCDHLLSATDFRILFCVCLLKAWNLSYHLKFYCLIKLVQANGTIMGFFSSSCFPTGNAVMRHFDAAS
jgi:hypothetical protein